MPVDNNTGPIGAWRLRRVHSGGGTPVPTSGGTPVPTGFRSAQRISAPPASQQNSEVGDATSCRSFFDSLKSMFKCLCCLIGGRKMLICKKLGLRAGLWKNTNEDFKRNCKIVSIRQDDKGVDFVKLKLGQISLPEFPMLKKGRSSIRHDVAELADRQQCIAQQIGNMVATVSDDQNLIISISKTEKKDPTYGKTIYEHEAEPITIPMSELGITEPADLEQLKEELNDHFREMESVGSEGTGSLGKFGHRDGCLTSIEANFSNRKNRIFNNRRRKANQQASAKPVQLKPESVDEVCKYVSDNLESWMKEAENVNPESLNAINRAVPSDESIKEMIEGIRMPKGSEIRHFKQDIEETLKATISRAASDYNKPKEQTFGEFQQNVSAQQQQIADHLATQARKKSEEDLEGYEIQTPDDDQLKHGI